MRQLSPSDHQLGIIKSLVDESHAALSPETMRMRGRDGRTIAIPTGFAAVQGRDGRIVAVPSGAGSLEGRDGRVVAIPPRHIGIENAKGRIVPKLRW